MSLKPVGQKCRVELYSDEEGTRLICANVDGCPLGHAGEIGPDCFGAGSAGKTGVVAGPFEATTALEASSGGDGPTVKTPEHAPDIPEVEPGAGISEGKSVGVESGIIPGRSSGPDSHMVVGEDEKWWLKDLHREQKVQEYVDKLNEISMDMYLEECRPVPPPIPILGPKESEEFLEQLDKFTLTPEQHEFYRDALQKFPFSKDTQEYVGPMLRRLKRRKRHTVRQSGGMIRMPGNKPEPPEPEDESLFETDDEVHGPVARKLKAQPELQMPQPTIERIEEPEEEPEEEEEKEPYVPSAADLDDTPDEMTLIDDMETTTMPSLIPDAAGYVIDLLIQRDEDDDHSAVLSIDNLTIEIMLGDFIEIVEALELLLPRMRKIQSS